MLNQTINVKHGKISKFDLHGPRVIQTGMSPHVRQVVPVSTRPPTSSELFRSNSQCAAGRAHAYQESVLVWRVYRQVSVPRTAPHTPRHGNLAPSYQLA